MSAADFNFITSDNKLFVVPSKYISYSPLLYTLVTTEMPVDRDLETNAITLDPIIESEYFTEYIKFLLGQKFNHYTNNPEGLSCLISVFNYMGHTNPLMYPDDVFLAKLETTWFRDNHKIHEVDSFHGLYEVPVDKLRLKLVEYVDLPPEKAYVAGSYAMYLAGFCEDPNDIDIFTIDKKYLAKYVKQQIISSGKCSVSVGKNCVDIDLRIHRTLHQDPDKYYDTMGTIIGVDFGGHNDRNYVSGLVKKWGLKKYKGSCQTFCVDIVNSNYREFVKDLPYSTKLIFDYFDHERIARHEQYEKLYEPYYDWDFGRRLTVEDITEYMKEPRTFVKKICKAHKVVAGKTVLSEESESTKQYVLKEYSSPAEIVHYFDLDCCGFLFDPTTKKIWATRRALVSVKNRMNYFDPEIASASYGYRLAKYAIRGYEPWLPFFDRIQVNEQKMANSALRFMLMNLPVGNTHNLEDFIKSLPDDFSYDYVSIILVSKLFNWLVPGIKTCVSSYNDGHKQLLREVIEGKIAYDPYEKYLGTFIRNHIMTSKKTRLTEIINKYPEANEDDILKWYSKSPYVSIPEDVAEECTEIC